MCEGTGIGERAHRGGEPRQLKAAQQRVAQPAGDQVQGEQKPFGRHHRVAHHHIHCAADDIGQRPGEAQQ